MSFGVRARLTRVDGVTAKGLLDDPVWLPVVLGDVDFEETADHVDFKTVTAGEFSVPSPGGRDARNLRSLDLETLTIKWDVPWLTAVNLITPAEIRVVLRDVLRARTAVKLLMTLQPSGETLFSEKVTLRSMVRSIRHGQAGIAYYDLAVREWRDPSVSRRSSGGTAKGGKAQFPARHKLDANDTGNSLAKHYYGRYDGAKRLLADIGLPRWGANSPIVSSRRFKVGQVVVIPAPGKDLNIGQGEGVLR